MGHPLGWVLVAGVCASMWGVGYCFLADVRKLMKPATLNTLYGATLFLVGWFLTIAHEDVENFYNLVSSTKMAVYTFLYIALFIGASNLQLVGYALIDGNSGPYNAICSCYPLVNLIIAYVFFGQKNLNLPYVIPAMLLIMCGIALLALAPPVALAPVPQPLPTPVPPTPTNHTDIPLVPLSTP